MVIGRGEIWWATLPSPRGSEPGYRRPVVVVQADSFNRSKLRTVIAAVITSNLDLAVAPGNIPLTRRQSRLPKESVINISQLVTLDRSFLVKKVARLSPRELAKLDAGLRLALAI
jgi:mRNA interferase MazF